MNNFKFDEKTKLFYAYVPTGHKNPNGTTEYKKIRSKSFKRLEDKINKIGGNNLWLNIKKIRNRDFTMPICQQVFTI